MFCGLIFNGSSRAAIHVMMTAINEIDRLKIRRNKIILMYLNENVPNKRFEIRGPIPAKNW